MDLRIADRYPYLSVKILQPVVLAVGQLQQLMVFTKKKADIAVRNNQFLLLVIVQGILFLFADNGQAFGQVAGFQPVELRSDGLLRCIDIYNAC